MDKENEDAKAILEKLPDGCSLEDVQYHLYVVEKIQRGIEHAEQEDTISQSEVESNFGKWAAKQGGMSTQSKAVCI